jgi:hypothetical protein
MAEPTLSTDWNSEYEFWHKIISQEVERLRFNEGYEPIRFDLYPTVEHKLAFIGKTRIGRVNFKITAHWARDKQNVRVLRIEVLKAP